MHSNTDTLLMAVPMIGILVAVFFRLDELIAAPKKRVVNRRVIAGSDENGQPLCIDPDGNPSR